MFIEIKKRIEKELADYLRDIDKSYALSSISPLLYKSIEEFILRPGKRIRPILFAHGYLGFKKKAHPSIFRGALAFELLHDYMLIHDDIIDKSDTRRGKPSLHVKINKYLSGYKNIKFNGQDLSMLVGDVIYAAAMRAFLSVREDDQNKEKALEGFIDAAIYTGTGEFIELMGNKTGIEETSKEDIYKIYDLKTAIYTFASPLSSGALLAGADKDQAEDLFSCGIYLGRAFQIKDDIIGTFSEEKESGKSNLVDLAEGKKTLLIWHAYKHSGKKNKAAIKKLLAKKNTGMADLHKIQKIITGCGTLDYAKEEMHKMARKAYRVILSSKMAPGCRDSLNSYLKGLING